MKVYNLWAAPEVNFLNGKAKSVPFLNPINKYGRVFFVSWISFMLSFMSWYAFPPLLSKTIKQDLHLTQIQVSNSNIVALVAGLFMRFITGPACDRWGPRKVMVAILMLGAIPTGLAGTISSANSLYIVRFFVGIVGASFVPCQVYCTGFFDKSVVGTANAFAAGWGNAGGGITYFVMPAVFDSLVKRQNLTAHVAWRVAFIVPCILLLATGAFVLFCCEDTPTGAWADRHLHAAVAAPIEHNHVETPSEKDSVDKESKKTVTAADGSVVEVAEAQAPAGTGHVEIVEKPSLKTAIPALFCLQTLMLALPYACTFGGELAVNSILGAYYLKHFPSFGQTESGRWASMFGLMNVVTRPLGGFIADGLYNWAGPMRGVHMKKAWHVFLVLMQGVFCMAIGFADPKEFSTLIGLVAGLAIFMDAANGSAFALVPHVNPHVNGLMSGTIGAVGNLGGVMFAVCFRFTQAAGYGYNRGIWIIGVCTAAIALLIAPIHPIPRPQRRNGGYMSS